MSWKTCLGAFASLAAMAGCVNLTSVAPPVTAAMSGVSGGAAAETLRAGRNIFTRQCAACHSADPVAKHDFPEWRRIVAEMSARTKLGATEESALLAYLHAAASQPHP